MIEESASNGKAEQPSSFAAHIPNEFARTWIAARKRGVFIPNAYIHINEGNINDARLFAQILYWFEPDEDNKPKVSIEKDGQLWLAKNHGDWFKETCLSIRTIRRSLDRLKERNLIVYEMSGFAGNKTPHIRPNWEEFERRIKIWMANPQLFESEETYNAALAQFDQKGQNGFVQSDLKGQNETNLTPKVSQSDLKGQTNLTKMVKPNTENTTEITTENKNFQPPSEADLPGPPKPSESGIPPESSPSAPKAEIKPSETQEPPINRDGMAEATGARPIYTSAENKVLQLAMAKSLTEAQLRKLNQPIFYFDVKTDKNVQGKSINCLYDEDPLYVKWVAGVLLPWMTNKFKDKLPSKDKVIDLMSNYKWFHEWRSKQIDPLREAEIDRLTAPLVDPVEELKKRVQARQSAMNGDPGIEY